MAPIKFEENIKEKLEKRTLEPSSQAWDRLSESLEADAKKDSNKTFWWLGIAASMVGIIFILNGFFNSSELNQIEPVLVDTEIKEVEIIENTNQSGSNQNIITVKDSNLVIENVSEVKNNFQETILKSKISKKQSIKDNSITQVDTNQKQEESIDNLILETPTVEVKLALLDSQEKISKTETDIDALLKKAQQNIANKNHTKSYSVDSKSLLQDVEGDIDESFRAKVFETIKTNYNKVKTAVAQRND